jgi:molybdate-binding protein/transcriptional regulator with XRE-family HTH domain
VTGVAGNGTGARLRLARQARGLSQQQLAGMAGVTRQALSAIESGHSDPSLRVALAISRALGMTVEELFGPGDPADPVLAIAIAGPGRVADPADRAASAARVTLAPVGDVFVALPLRGDTAARSGFTAAGGLIAAPSTRSTRQKFGLSGVIATESPNFSATGVEVLVQPLGPPRPTLVVAGCDPALPLLETPLALLDPPVAFAWWPCGSGEALDLASRGLVHVAGVHSAGVHSAGVHSAGVHSAGVHSAGVHSRDRDILGGAEVVGFSAWREGLVIRPELAGKIRGLDDIARYGVRLVNREPGAEARRVLDAEAERLGIHPAGLPGYDTRATGHLQVASAVAAGTAGAGVASEPAALAYGLAFIPLADESFDLILPAKQLGSREVQALLRVLTSPWLLAQLASLPGYDPSRCGERLAPDDGR